MPVPSRPSTFHRRSSLALVTATLVLGLGTLTAVAGGGGGPPTASNPRTSTQLSGVLKGTIVDWPQGQTGELQLEGEGNTVAQGKVDAQGNFTLTLPGVDRVGSSLISVASVFVTDSNSSEPCVGQGTVTPTTASGNGFSLNVYQNGTRLGDIGLRSTAMSPAPPGEYVTQLFFHDQAVTLNGSVTCEHRVERYSLRQPAGWSLASVQGQGVDQTGREVVTYTGNPLPKNMAWRLYAEFGSPGFDFDADRSRGDGFRVSNVMWGQAAEKAGLTLGDLIVQVDGRDMTPLNNWAFLRAIRGQPGTKVTLGVQRGPEKKMVSITATRVLVRNP